MDTVAVRVARDNDWEGNSSACYAWIGGGKRTRAVVDSELLDGVVGDGKRVDGNRWATSEAGCEFRNNDAKRCWGRTLRCSSRRRCYLSRS